MKLWNFVHLNLGTHVYLLFALILLIVMAILGVVHALKQRKRDLDNDEELRRLAAESPSDSNAEGQKED